MIKTAIRRFKSLFTRVHELHNALDAFPYYFRRTEYEKIIFGDAGSGVTDRDYCGRPVVVSLTSYGRRLIDVCFTIESIMQQSWRPNRIVLWLAPDDMENPLPEALVRQQARGLEIRRTPDIRSYKKLLPALEAMPDACIVTVDDDMIYDFDLLERLIKGHIANPHAIVSTKTYRVAFDRRRRLLPYRKWDRSNDGPGERRAGLFLLGGPGTLYPPGSLAPEVGDTALCMKLSPGADDVWFNIMARRQGTPIVKIPVRHPEAKEYIDNRNMLDTGLARQNVDNNANDSQLAAVLAHFNLDPYSLFMKK